MTRKDQIIKHAINSRIIDDKLTAIGIMDFDALKDTVDDVYAAFPANFYHTFAVKANALIEVLSALRQFGMGAEVASAGELKIALAAGFTTDQIIYDSPAKTIDDLRTCLAHDISLNIDNLQELARIDDLMGQFPVTKSVIGFRINAQIGGGDISSTSTATATSKFGYPLEDEGNRVRLVDIYKKRPWLTSMHTHSGSQGCALSLMAEGVAALTNFAEQINESIGRQQIIRLDIGGGLPVNFSSDEVTPSFAEYASVLADRVPILFGGKYQVKTEFGRAIAAKNGLIITRVEYTKSAGRRHIATTHAGAQILARTAFLPNTWPIRATGYQPDATPKTAANSEVVATDVAGPCCFAGDLICVNKQLPKLSPKDYVMVHETGAYYFSNHFDYNSLPRVAVYAASGKLAHLTLKCIRQADSLQDVMDRM